MRYRSLSSADGRPRAPRRCVAAALAAAACALCACALLLAAQRTEPATPRRARPSAAPRSAHAPAATAADADTAPTQRGADGAAAVGGPAPAAEFAPRHNAPCDELSAGLVQYAARNNTVLLTGAGTREGAVSGPVHRERRACRLWQ
jgi:hypothetical protein